MRARSFTFELFAEPFRRIHKIFTAPLMRARERRSRDEDTFNFKAIDDEIRVKPFCKAPLPFPLFDKNLPSSTLNIICLCVCRAIKNV